MGQGTVRSYVPETRTTDDRQSRIRLGELLLYMRTDPDSHRVHASSTITRGHASRCVVVSGSRPKIAPPHD